MSRTSLLAILLLFTVGCSSILPSPPIKVTLPAYTNYEAVAAWQVALVTATADTTPDNPSPTPSNLKEGDDCPNCVDGKMDGDGVTRPECWHCLGDGICNKNDPILLSPGDYVITIFGDLVKDLEFHSKPKKEVEKVPGEESIVVPPKVVEAIPPQKEYVTLESFYIVKDGNKFTWDGKRWYDSTRMREIRNLGTNDPTKSSYVTICYGTHCQRYDIFKESTRVEKPNDEPRSTERLTDGTGSD